MIGSRHAASLSKGMKDLSLPKVILDSLAQKRRNQHVDIYVTPKERNVSSTSRLKACSTRPVNS